MYRMHVWRAGCVPALVLMLAACSVVPPAGTGSTTGRAKAPRPPAGTPAAPPSAATLILPSTYPSAEAERLFRRLIPARVMDSPAWASDLVLSMETLSVPITPDNVCSVIAVIEQESAFSADPEVPNLPQIAMRAIEERRLRYNIPHWMVEKGLDTKSSDGRSYRARIATLKTESEVSRLFEDINAAVPDLARAYAEYNPVNTGGAMQVSIAFAEDHARQHAYPWGRPGSVRREVFTRRGGLYFGVAMLLDYSAPYPTPVYRFADYNAGRFSSRNAAFQLATAQVSGVSLVPDGDLLIYQLGKPQPAVSNTERALQRIAAQLRMNAAEIRRDLLLEKSETFAASPLWQRLYGLADAQAGQGVPRVAMPQIAVNSAKFRRTLTTQGYASQVEGRWNGCMQRQKAIVAESWASR